MDEFRKEYETAAAFVEDLETHLKLGGVLLEHSTMVEPRKSAKLTLFVGKKEIASLEAETVYVAPAGDAFQVGLELKNAWQAALDAAKVKIATLEEEEGGRKWGKDAESLYHKIAEMETHQKIQVALKGGREERRILLKDTHFMVHPYILKNPKLASDEVAQIARMSTLTGEMIKTISENTEWMSNMAVRLSIVKNPKTPANIVQKHILKLKDSDLLLIAKSDNVRDAVSKMAKRVLASRGRPVI